MSGIPLTSSAMKRAREREHARAILDICEIPLKVARFDDLRPHQIQNLREAANAASFIRPKHLRAINADRARCYFDHVRKSAL